MPSKSSTWKAFYFFVFLFLSFSSNIFSAETSLQPKYGGELVLATTSDPKSFNDILAKETSTSAILRYIFEGLTTENADTLKVEPLLAKSWDVSEDGLVWTFHLRDNVKWSDGVAFSADDVVFTFNDLIYNDSIPSSARDVYTVDGKIFKVEKVDALTVRFTLPVKFAPFLRGMGQSILPKHKLEKIVKEGRFNYTWGIDTPPNEIVGTGPFCLYSYQPGERVVLKRNPLYWKKSAAGNQLPYLNKVIYLIVQSEDTLLLKFKDGEVDYVALSGMEFPLIKPLEKKGNFTVYDTGPAFGSNFLVFNQNAGMDPKNQKPFVEPKKLAWFTNLSFRQAAAHAVDKQKIVEILMNGMGYPQESAMSPSSGFFYNPSVAVYPYDLKKAKEILTKSGFVDRDGDGVIEDQKGNKVEFNLFTNSGSSDRVQIAAIIKHDLEKLGMKVNFLALEFNSLVAKLTSSYDWDAVILGLTGGVEPHFGSNVWMSSGQLHLWYPKQTSPATNWERRTDEIFNLGVQELNEEKRKVLYDEHQRIVAEQLPVIYTVLNSQLFAVRNKFGNLRPTSYGGAFHNIEEIYVK